MWKTGLTDTCRPRVMVAPLNFLSPVGWSVCVCTHATLNSNYRELPTSKLNYPSTIKWFYFEMEWSLLTSGLDCHMKYYSTKGYCSVKLSFIILSHALLCPHHQSQHDRVVISDLRRLFFFSVVLMCDVMQQFSFSRLSSASEEEMK